MKKLIREIFPKKQYENLARLKNKALLFLMQKEFGLLSSDPMEFVESNPEMEQLFLKNLIDNIENLPLGRLQDLIERLLANPEKLTDSLLSSIIEKLLSHPEKLPDSLLLWIKSKTNLIQKMDYEKHDIFLSIESDLEYHIRSKSCAKEPETVEWIETFFQEGDILFDIGANVGVYSLVTAKFWKDRVITYAFEPSFLNFKQLCQNLVINNCNKSIVPLQIALSDRTSIETLNYQNLTAGGALHALGEAVDYQGNIFQPVFQQPVLSYAIDDAIAQLFLPVPNHLKIDVDGVEFLILKGAEETLKHPQIKSILIEVEKDNENSKNVLSFLELSGFKIHSKHQYLYGGIAGKHSNTYNYIFQKS